jgi:hypothetical protein
MTITPRDRRALILLGVSAVVALLVWAALDTPDTAPVVTSVQSVPQAERRLVKSREMIAATEGKEKVLEQLQEALAEREKGMITAETAAQAQASIVQSLRKIASQQAPPVELRSVEIGPVKPYGDAYGEATVAVSMVCHIEQLVNVVAELSQQPEAIATTDVRVLAGDPRQKTITARLTLAGLVARSLVPEKKGPGAL